LAGCHGVVGRRAGTLRQPSGLHEPVHKAQARKFALGPRISALPIERTEPLWGARLLRGALATRYVPGVKNGIMADLPPVVDRARSL